ncbi:DUF938 domain-containing protein [Ruegeria arenilitoris]|uniref:DUF938 domain-containing protein n=1 Tax=Ruegeria arenilitoris TaxID=1173585 RepID=UPI00147D8EA9|nr:DUF938 domain-containing protein [Ruegeria arenilitoris]
MKRTLPSNASVASKSDGGRLVAPAASRNSAVLCELLERVAPASGHALELASGTGQHAAAFAQRLPDLVWQPSEVDPERRISIDAYTKGLANVNLAVDLDATAKDWHKSFGGQDLIVLVNLLHLISWWEVKTLVFEAAQALNIDGQFVVYGPFMREGRLTSNGDIQFHEALVQQDPEIGYKNDMDMLALFQRCRLEVTETKEMPANNLAFVTKKARQGEL